MNDQKRANAQHVPLTDCGISCSDLPVIVATAQPEVERTKGPRIWKSNKPDPLCSANYDKR